MRLRVQGSMKESRSFGMSVSNVTDDVIEARRPDIVILNKGEKNCFIGDISFSGDWKLSKKEGEKVEKYEDLKREIM